jgi:ABC-type amino acid transport substrate-binding protein
MFLVAAAGCGSPDSAAPPVLPDATAQGALPVPDGVRTMPPGPAGGVSVNGCDASLRPAGPLPSPGAMPAGSTMAAIVRRGYLIAGVDEDTYLFSYRNPSRDPHAAPMVGFDIDVVRQISQAIFGSPDRVRYRIITKAQRIQVLRNHSVDLVADVMTIDCDRARQVSFSAEYFEGGQRVLVEQSSTARSIADLAGKRVCAAAGTTSLQTLANPAYHLIPAKYHTQAGGPAAAGTCHPHILRHYVDGWVMWPAGCFRWRGCRAGRFRPHNPGRYRQAWSSHLRRSWSAVQSARGSGVSNWQALSMALRFASASARA